MSSLSAGTPPLALPPVLLSAGAPGAVFAARGGLRASTSAAEGLMIAGRGAPAGADPVRSPGAAVLRSLLAARVVLMSAAVKVLWVVMLGTAAAVSAGVVTMAATLLAVVV